MTSLSCDTIAAIATPHGNGGVGIVRISGKKSLPIAQKLMTEKIALVPRHATLVTLNLGKVRDTSIAIYFKSPNSFTGEDILELQCHGGMMLVDKVLDTVITNGARLASPGEFTRRALMNGKITLTGAESLIDTIHAESEAELEASDLTCGELHQKMIAVEKELVNISAQVFAALDHPEEVPVPNIAPRLKQFIKTLKQFTDNARTSSYIYNGIRVAILGEPNVGKSSLFNALLGSSRSIVTEIPGTTTDTVSETVQIEGYKVRFVDTAGIRESENKIEKLGIERTRQAALDCDIALVFDDTALDLVKGKPFIRVTRTTNIEHVKKQIIQMTVGKFKSRSVANARQLNELSLALRALENALKQSMPDVIASDIQTALFHLGNITGTNTSEAVLDEIFSRFCLGK